MSVLISVGGEPTLGPHLYNRAYFQTPGRYICVILKTVFRRCLFSQAAIKLYPAPTVKVFFRWGPHPHGIYNAYLPDIKRISLSNLRKLNKFKMAAIW